MRARATTWARCRRRPRSSAGHMRSILPSFPKRGPISLLVTVATALLALTYVLARELIGAPSQRRAAPSSEPLSRERRRVRVEPAAPPKAEGSPVAKAEPAAKPRGANCDSEPEGRGVRPRARAAGIESGLSGSSRVAARHLDPHLPTRRCRRRAESATAILPAIAGQGRCEAEPGAAAALGGSEPAARADRLKPRPRRKPRNRSASAAPIAARTVRQLAE